MNENPDSNKDDRFFPIFIISSLYVFTIYIVFCGWFYGKTVYSDDEEAFFNIRIYLTFVLLPLFLFSHFRSLINDQGNISSSYNKLYVYLHHAFIVVLKREINYNKFNNIETLELINSEESKKNSDLNSLFHQLRVKISCFNFNKINVLDISKNVEEFIDLIEKIIELENESFETCLTCNFKKLYKVHHCSVCNKCLINMDHHCPWILNCVSLDNGKNYLLFCFYLMLSTLIWVVTSFRYYIIPTLIEKQVNDNKLQFLFMFTSTWGSLGFSVFGLVMFVKYMKNVKNNTTYIDELRNIKFPKRGLYHGLSEIFGHTNFLLWFIPYKPSKFQKLSILISNLKKIL